MEDQLKERVGQRIKDFWTSQELGIRPGVTVDDIRAFERKYSVRLPPDMADYFLTIDGMYDSDNEGFAFWPLHHLKTVPEETVAYSNFDDAGSYFVFSDYLIWSWAYAIRLSGDLSQENTVIGIGWDLPKRMAKSFSDFVELYFVDHPILYGAEEAET